MRLEIENISLSGNELEFSVKIFRQLWLQNLNSIFNFCRSQIEVFLISRLSINFFWREKSERKWKANATIFLNKKNEKIFFFFWVKKKKIFFIFFTQKKMKIFSFFLIQKKSLHLLFTFSQIFLASRNRRSPFFRSWKFWVEKIFSFAFHFLWDFSRQKKSKISFFTSSLI